MAAISLNDLIAALSHAVVQAQDEVEQHQLDLLGMYFSEDGRPSCLQVMVPKMGLSPSDTDHTLLLVPRISLTEPTMLHISEFQVSFEVELGELSAPDEAPAVLPGDGLDHAPTRESADAPAADGGSAAATDSSGATSIDPPTSPNASGEAPATPDTRAMPAALAGTDGAPVAARGLRSQLSRFTSYFGAPRVFPNIGPDAVGSSPVVPATAAGAPDVPAASSGLTRAADVPIPQRDPAANDPAAQPQMTVGLGPKTSNISTAKATLKVISRPPSDGMFRLLNHLNKTF